MQLLILVTCFHADHVAQTIDTFVDSLEIAMLLWYLLYCLNIKLIHDTGCYFVNIGYCYYSCSQNSHIIRHLLHNFSGIKMVKDNII